MFILGDLYYPSDNGKYSERHSRSYDVDENYYPAAFNAWPLTS